MTTISTSRVQLEQMLQRGQAGEPQFAEALVSQYYNDVYRLACAIMGDEQDAQDATQEAFIDALLYIERFQPGTNLRAWLGRIAVHKCQTLLRKRKTRQALEGALQGIQRLFARPPSVVDTVLQNEANTNVWEAVNGLDEKHRLPVILYYIYDLPVQEIAGLLKVRTGTVHSRLHYALRKLRGVLSLEEMYPGKRILPEPSERGS